jgi:hypothetical protein
MCQQLVITTFLPRAHLTTSERTKQRMCITFFLNVGKTVTETYQLMQNSIADETMSPEIITTETSFSPEKNRAVAPFFTLRQ